MRDKREGKSVRYLVSYCNFSDYVTCVIPNLVSLTIELATATLIRLLDFLATWDLFCFHHPLNACVSPPAAAQILPHLHAHLYQLCM